MLCRYKKALEKLAMGLLSFNPEQKDLKKLRETMCCYETEETWQLYLWKQNDEYLGLIGVQHDGDVAYVQHVSVMPSHRGEGIARRMVEAVEALPNVTRIESVKANQSLIENCIKQL